MSSESLEDTPTQAIPSELDYSKDPYMSPRYEWSLVTQQTNNYSVTVDASGATESIFQIPGGAVYNLAKSYICFDMSVPAAGAGNFDWVPSSLIPTFSQVQLYPQGGLMLTDLNYAQNYTNIVTFPETKLEDFRTYDKYTPAALVANASGYSQFLQEFLPTGNTNYRNNNTVASQFSYEPKYHYIGGDNAAIAQSFKIPLSMFKNTILALNKDLYFNGEVMNLRFVWSPISKLYFTATSATNATSGPAAAANNVSVTNLKLYLAVEKNDMIKQKVMKEFSDGIDIAIPFVWAIKQNPGASTSQAVACV
mgnify:CR=1 FL=1